MASILIASIPGHGHVTPLLAVARAFVERGDHVRFITGARFADRIAATGASHIPLAPEADYDESLLDQFPERAKLKGTKAIAFDIEHVFVRPTKAQYETVMAALAARPADAVLMEPGFTGGAILVGHPRTVRPPVVVCGVVPLPISDTETAPCGMGLPPARWANKQRNAVLAAVSRRILAHANSIGDQLYREVHDEGLPCSLLEWCRCADVIMQFTVAAFEYPRADVPTALHFVGPLRSAESRGVLPNWWSDLDGSRPVVHVTQGTVANRDYRQAIAPTLEALADEDVLTVVSTGGRPLDTLPPLPENARAAEYLPYDELLPRTAVYVTNGGYGGVQCALRHGVPIVATGGKEDKPEVGARVAWSGVGRRIRSERPSVKALRRDILAVLTQPRYREASQRISADMAAAPGFGALADVVDELVGAAR
ncbi:glycosyl transferase [Mycobacterium intermedium]|uniref:Glycosyl transferase n=1 Tax=Mycobacterium intermedium TaxID=28445 RepID=A0A1E3SGL4_MYCIE|nr:nucleotide disphospho-sugar-binding domain-containing protein [Mycobacterium intermedium]MCV6966680.1 glycosyltransferase [Mycobacterium intermedium]ODR00803.1 glycosyl transferase [Mycobacterium intermedium]OPE52121.1 glycosyl transferase [Mycobacterium intermedium]ORB10591.1 glycosyl transferase [Mycobacterium intermedium]